MLQTISVPFVHRETDKDSCNQISIIKKHFSVDIWGLVDESSRTFHVLFLVEKTRSFSNFMSDFCILLTKADRDHFSFMFLTCSYVV